jgi:integration host factor subunit beta
MHNIIIMSTKDPTKYRSDVVAMLRKSSPELSGDDLEKIVDLILDEISTGLSCGDRVEIRGFGSMSIRQRHAGVVRNPKSGEKVNSNERASFYFRPSKEFLKTLNESTANTNLA